ncbi:MAG: hypothetical protein U1F43_13585 [Myxococcota bacterium]
MTRSFLSLAALLLALSALGADARANSVSLELFDVASGSAVSGGDLQIGKLYKLSIAVTRDAGLWSGTEVTLHGASAVMKTYGSGVAPDAVVFDGAGANGATYAPLMVTPSPPALRPHWTLPDTTTSEAETVELVVVFAYDPSSTLDLTPVDFVVDVTATRGGAAVSFGSSIAKTARGDAGIIYHNAEIVRVSGFDHASLGAGVVVRYDVRIRDENQTALRPVPGSAIFPASVDFRFDVGPNLVPLRAWAGQDNSWAYPQPYPPAAYDEFDLDLDGSYTPQMEEDLTRVTTGDVASRITEPLRPVLSGGYPNIGIYPGYTLHQTLDVFVPCSALVEPWLDRQGPDWGIVVRTRGTEPTYLGTVKTYDTSFTLSVPPLVDECGVANNSKVVKYPDDGWGYQATVGSVAQWWSSLDVPLGVTSVQGATIVDALPSDVDLVFASNIDSSVVASCDVDHPCASGSCVDGQCAGGYGARVYFCDVAPGAHFGRSEFLTYRANAAAPMCRPAVPATPSAPTVYWNYYWAAPAAVPHPTHIVHYAELFRDQDAIPDGITRFGASYLTRIAHAPSGGKLENTTWFAGRPVLGGVVGADFDDGLVEPEGEGGARDSEGAPPDFFEDDAFYTVVDYACVSTQTYDLGPTVLDPGDCSWAGFLIRSNEALLPVVDATLEVTPPPGVIVEHVDGGPYEPYPAPGVTYPGPTDGIVSWYADCSVGGSLSEPSPSDSPLVWQFRDGCRVYPGAYTRIYVEFCTDPTYPYIDGPTLPFTLRVPSYRDAPDSAGGQVCGLGFRGPQDGERPVDEQEPSRTALFSMRMLGRQVASVAAVCAPDHAPTFVVHAANPSGKALSGTALSFAMPSGATLADISDVTPASGASIEVRDGPSGAWVARGAIADALVREVRLVGLPGAPGGLTLTPYTGEAGFTVHLATSAAPGTELAASGAVTTAELGTTNAAALPFVVGSCQTLTLEKYWDENQNGRRDEGELALSGWTFTVTNTAGATVGSGVTGTDGAVSIEVPAGTYTATETLPEPTGGVTWMASTAGGESKTATLSGLSQTLAFGNVCQCGGDQCVGSICTPNGDTTATCTDGAPVSCDDHSLCTDDACDPDSGCSHDPVECGDGDNAFYAPVQDASGQLVGAIRCRIVAGTTVCDTGPDEDHDGRPDLVIYKDAARACESR